MSSDFESLSCDDEDTHLRHGNRAAHSSGSFDSLDDLVAEQDAQLLRCLPMVQDSHNLRRGLIDDSEDDSPAAAYGHRAYGVTGHHRTPAQPASHSLLHHLGLSRAASHQPQQQQQQPSSVDHFNKKSQSGRASKNNSAGGGGVDQGDPSRGKSSVHLFTPQPKESPDLPPPLLSSRATSPETRTTHSAMPCTVSRPPFSAPLSAEDEGPPFHNDGVDDLARQAHTRYRTAADVNDGDDAAWQATGASATSPLLQQPQQRSQQESSQTWRVTCPPDSGQITPATSAATLTASATTRRSAAGYHDNDNENEEEERQHPRSSTDTRDRGSSAEAEELATLIDHEHPSAPANSAVAAAAAEVVDVSVPVATVGSGAAPPVRAGHDADGFYRTGLLEDSTEDEDEDTTAGGTTTNSQRKAVAALAEGGNGDVVPPLRTRDAAAVLQQGTVHAAMQAPALSSLTTQPPPSTTTAAESLSASSTLRGKLAMATEELHRVAAAMPRMTNVHVLSLIITVLVPINVLCLDVMAFAWIRRQVDTRYRFSVGLARSSGSSNTTTTCMGSSFLLRGKDLLPLSTFDSGKQGSLLRCLDGEESNSMQQHLSDSHHHSNCSSSSSSKTPINISSNSNTHAIPTLCSIFLWLMFPNGLLARLLLLQRTSWKAGSAAGASLTQTAPSADGLPEQTEVVWASHLYERLRQSAPQLAVLELYVHYAYLWAMVHAAVLLDHWMPTKAGSEPTLPLPGMGKAHG